MTRQLTSADVVCRDGQGAWLRFDRPHTVVTTLRIDEVLECLQQVERFVAGGWYAAGYIGYEAAPAFDASLAAFAPDSVPLLWFGIFPKPIVLHSLPQSNNYTGNLQWRPTVTPEEYLNAVTRIKSYIARGDTYQVNYTYRLHAPFEDNPWEFFCTISNSHPMPYAVYVDTGRYKICSFSPELFFRLDGNLITMQPMKGTSRRGRFTGEDLFLARRLQCDGKERAENIMIVDMVRNDIGKVATKGSVRVPEICTIQRYQSVTQMVSTVQGNVDAPFLDLIRALFPCASVTGAPKIRTSQIIRELESTPRHVYCGAIGWYGSRRQGCFNVAIRTMLIDCARKQAEFGTGSGIVWESTVDHEFEECRLKAVVVTSPQPCFQLIETLLWSAGSGYFLLERHIDRLMDSGSYFSFPVNRVEVGNALQHLAASFNGGQFRVRLAVDHSGRVVLESSALVQKGSTDAAALELTLARRPVDSGDRFLFHKTTIRTQYEEARKQCTEGDDLIFWNERGEITETTIGNVVLEINGKLFTPAADSGLLAGVFRAELIGQGTVQEKKLMIHDLKMATRLFRINSVRKWQECRLSI